MPNMTTTARVTLEDVSRLTAHGIRTPQYHDISGRAVIHPSARIWEFVTICDEVIIAEDVVIGSHCFLGAGCYIGNGSRLQSHVFLAPGTWIGQRVFVGPGVITTDDKYPKVGHAYAAEPPRIGDGASIGAGAILLPGVQIGTGAMVGAGALVSHNVPGETLVCGNPARIHQHG